MTKFRGSLMARLREGLVKVNDYKKWLEDSLNFAKIKNLFGSFQTNLKADAWWVPPNF